MPSKRVDQGLGSSLAPAPRLRPSGPLGVPALYLCGPGRRHRTHGPPRQGVLGPLNVQVHCAGPRPCKNSDLASSGHFYCPGSGFLERRATSHARELGSGEFLQSLRSLLSIAPRQKGALFVEPAHDVGLNMLLDSIFNRPMNVDIH